MNILCKTPKWQYHLLALVTAAIWGTTFVSTKVLLSNGLTPEIIFLLRFLIGYGMLWIIYPKREPLKHKNDEWLFVALGALGGSVYFLTENIALEITYASNVSLIVSTAPLMTALLAHYLFKTERTERYVWIGGLIALIGVAMIVYNGNFVLELNPLGDILSFVAALCWAFYSILLKRMDQEYSVLYLTRKIFFYGILTILPWFLFFPVSFDLNILARPVVWGNLLFLGAVASSLCFLAWNVSIRHLGSIVTNNYIYIIPIVTIICSELLLDEHITLISIAGALFILLGVCLSNRKEK